MGCGGHGGAVAAGEAALRLESSVTSVSWIPSEAITESAPKVPFAVGAVRFDPPPPDHLDDVASFVAADRCRLANRLSAWIDVEDGVVTDCGHTGRGFIGALTFRIAALRVRATPAPLPDRRSIDWIGSTAVRFEQSTGGCTGLPGRPSWSRSALYWRMATPLAWTTLALTLHADGTVQFELVGASPFPRHWIYDGDGELRSKTATMDFAAWNASAFAQHTPWGGENSDAVVREVESALERELSAEIMSRGTAAKIRRLRPGATLTEQGQPGDELYLLLDGVLQVEVDGRPIAEVGPGAVLGERARLEDSRRRTATLRAVTRCVVATTAFPVANRDALWRIADTHRRETDD
jgi:hypothetical protein